MGKLYHSLKPVRGRGKGREGVTVSRENLYLFRVTFSQVIDINFFEKLRDFVACCYRLQLDAIEMGWTSEMYEGGRQRYKKNSGW